MTATALPQLRQELELLPARMAVDGTKQYMLFDPVRNAFHMLNEKALKLLKLWTDLPQNSENPLETLLEKSRQTYPETIITSDDIEEMTSFILTQNLSVHPPQNDSETFAKREAAMRRPWYETILHKYLYFRIPLVKPTKFLNAFAPSLRWMFNPLTWMVIGVLGLIGLYFTSRQWDQFLTTFWHFFTFEGFIFYGITLVILKSLHELGHAFTAHHFGARVPIIGIAFLVMFPVLYTDTTDAWRLTERRKRLLIDGGGMIVELGIACLAIFLWSFLPDGPARSMAFFIATASWTLSLIVNLNPCMRFDGYYLLGDFFNVQNLQKHGFDMGRWKMREVLFDLGAPKPFDTSPVREKGLCAYAYTTWVYRFFLFIGIAILVHHLFPKAIGIVLFTVEILWFIVLPIWREMKNWWSFRMTILSTRRGRLTLSAGLILLAILFWPWQGRIAAPALLQPVQHTEIYPASAGYIDRIYVKSGDTVRKGDPLFTLSSETVLHEREQSRRRLALIDAQIDRRTASLIERRAGHLLDADKQAEIAVHKGLNNLISDLVILAPHDGYVSDVMSRLHKGRFVQNTSRLARIINPTDYEIIAFPGENSALRLQKNAKVKFISDEPYQSGIEGHIDKISPTSLSQIKIREITSYHGGRLGVVDNPDGTLSPQKPILKVRIQCEDCPAFTRFHRGTAFLDAKAQSPAMAVWKNIARVLIRETDF